MEFEETFFAPLGLFAFSQQERKSPGEFPPGLFLKAIIKRSPSAARSVGLGEGVSSVRSTSHARYNGK